MLTHVATVLRGSAAAQAISLLALPVLARLFAPEAFGAAQIFQSVIAILLVTAALRFDVALLTADEGDELKAVTRLCLLLNVGVSALLAALVTIAAATGWPAALARLPFPLLLLPVGLFFGGVAQTLTFLATRRAAFAASSNSKVAQSVGNTGAALTIGGVAPFGGGLVFADIAGRIAQALYLAAWTIQRAPEMLRARPARELRAAARKFRNYPLFSLPGGIINAGAGALAPIVVFAFYGAANAGQFGLSERALGLPIGLVVLAASQVYSSQFSDRLRRGDTGLRKQFWHLVIVMGMLGILPGLILVASAPTLFALAFGEEWRSAGEFARIMAPAYVSALCVGPVNMTLLLLGRQRFQFAWEAMRLALLLLPWLVASQAGIPMRSALLLYAVTVVLANAAFLLISDRELKRRVHAMSTPGPAS